MELIYLLAPEDKSSLIMTMPRVRLFRHCKLLKKYHTELFPRSSISKYNLVLANSVATIDRGYRNEILLRYKYIFQPEDMIVVQEDILRVYGRVNNENIYQKGDKIAQIKARRWIYRLNLSV